MEDDKKQQLPGIIPSKQFQEKRLKIVKCLLDEETTNYHSKERLKDKFNKSISQQSTRQKIVTTFSLMNSSELSSLIDVAVPHTTQLKTDDEIDGLNSLKYSNILPFMNNNGMKFKIYLVLLNRIIHI